ncbi:RNase P modulator RnpM [Butyrivibrio sp. FCS014]|uniref:RNase P modulator RnpM n=1 Tax=Butyrivibrio sp. FCS014 TaxID=1408304 RepID=UPI00046412CB|nr:YlxR family protein [Butyrivibrio sp. FCS014]
MQKKIPTRKCVGCGEMKEKKELIRIIKTPEGEILVDTTGKANGRGAYICSNAECFRKAVRNKALRDPLNLQFPPMCLSVLKKELG